MMKVLDYFTGTGSVKKVAEKLGHQCIGLDNQEELNPDIVGDIMNIDLGKCDYAHFSPPCTGFSVASIGRHWTEDKKPKSETSKMGIRLAERVAELIKINKYKYWTVENPRGMFRKVFPKILQSKGVVGWRMETVSYCQYGDERMKPTDIFTNIPKWKGKCCKNGMPCHVAAPRGSKTGTQGLKSAKERGVIPPKLIEEIFEQFKKVE